MRIKLSTNWPLYQKYDVCGRCVDTSLLLMFALKNLSLEWCIMKQLATRVSAFAALFVLITDYENLLCLHLRNALNLDVNKSNRCNFLTKSALFRQISR